MTVTSTDALFCDFASVTIAVDIPGFLPSTYREYAAYADGTIFFTRQFELGLGVRYSRQKQAYDETVSGLLATGSAAVLTPPVATSDQSVTTYLINPKFHITDDVMVYARAASGFRPGGPNFVLSPGLGNPTFAPDRLWRRQLRSQNRWGWGSHRRHTRRPG